MTNNEIRKRKPRQNSEKRIWMQRHTFAHTGILVNPKLEPQYICTGPVS